MRKIRNLAVADVFDAYPAVVRKKLLALRALIYEVASEYPAVGELDECLKWGEPSYAAKGGSAVRINWKPFSPAQIFVYFNCKTLLVETFKELYGDRFRYQGNRAIVFDEQDEIPTESLKHCISLSLNYHRIKHLPLLGA